MEDIRERQDELGQTSSTLVNRQNTSSTRNRCSTEVRSDGGSSWNCLPSNRYHKNPPNRDPDGSDDNDEENGIPCRNNNNANHGRPNNGSPPFPSNGGGGGGNPRGGGGGNDPRGNSSLPNMNSQGNVPYGNLVAMIRNELKQEQLPVWDGNKDTAIEYFWKIQQLAALEGDIPVALGYWLWKSLKENSRIWMWFTTLPFSEQSRMRTHYLHYLKGIKDNYLGRSWQISMNRKYENQTFR